MKNFIYSRIISFFPDYRQKSQKSCPAESPAQELLRLEHLIILLTAEQNLNKVVTMGEPYISVVCGLLEHGLSCSEAPVFTVFRVVTNLIKN